MAKEKTKTKAPVKKKRGWFQKIPIDVLLSPGGMVLIFYAIFMEVLDWIPIPVADQLWELPFEIGFMILLALIAKTSFKSMVIPFILERIPVLSDILPTWVIRMLV